MKLGYQTLCIAAALLMGSPTNAGEPSAPNTLIDRATGTVKEFLDDENAGWFRNHVRRASAIMVVPSMIKVGFIVGAGGGDAVLVARDVKTGEWSDPAFYKIGGFSVGLQAGGEKARAIHIIRSKRRLDSLLRSLGKVAVQSSVAVGPVGAGAASSIAADILTFAKSKGAFAGMSLKGSVVEAHAEYNHAYYGKQVSARDIVIERAVTNSTSNKLKQLLEAIK